MDPPLSLSSFHEEKGGTISFTTADLPPTPYVLPTHPRGRVLVLRICDINAREERKGAGSEGNNPHDTNTGHKGDDNLLAVGLEHIEIIELCRGATGGGGLLNKDIVAHALLPLRCHGLRESGGESSATSAFPPGPHRRPWRSALGKDGAAVLRMSAVQGREFVLSAVRVGNAYMHATWFWRINAPSIFLLLFFSLILTSCSINTYHFISTIHLMQDLECSARNVHRRTPNRNILGRQDDFCRGVGKGREKRGWKRQ